MVDTVVAELGGLHIAVNNAGINKNSAAEDTTEQDWDLTFDLNTKGVFLCCQVCSSSIVLSKMWLARHNAHLNDTLDALLLCQLGSSWWSYQLCPTVPRPMSVSLYYFHSC